MQEKVKFHVLDVNNAPDEIAERINAHAHHFTLTLNELLHSTGNESLSLNILLGYLALYIHHSFPTKELADRQLYIMQEALRHHLEHIQESRNEDFTDE